ncbi:DoxX family protein [Paenibacillus brasilensis]|uniref:Membrane protein YphA (DoxX/SURF4 family) n=1 Tax=Paenibacillus brasilensis TaxID=128574 RepID=A0ABU0L5K9_9BACL|nr:DoxX family protein [Paenibacillus brasilensis]MDQ0496546.1 putative membrane protein YphA (DoxX/SURF4 family) [Paenibacillus brasilensis]
MHSMSFYANTVLRILTGVIFFMHGKFKLEWGYSNLSEWLHSQGFPLAAFFAHVLPWIELLGGIIMIIGIGTRYLAILFSLILLVALFKVKIATGFISNTNTGYEFDLLLMIVCLHVTVTSPNSLKQVWMTSGKGGETKHV